MPISWSSQLREPSASYPAACRRRFASTGSWVLKLIVTKLRWSLLGHRFKDHDDARDVIAVQGDRLDWIYVYYWCDQHGTRVLLDEIRQSIPPI